MKKSTGSLSSRRSRRRWLAGLGAIAGIWVFAYAAVLGLRSFDETAEKIVVRIETASLAKMPSSDREAHLADLAARVNRLDLEERTRLRQSGALEAMFEEMTEAEKAAFLEATLPQGMRQMMEALNEMPAEERRRAVDRALRSLRRASAEEISREMEDVHARMIVDEGLKAYFEVASAETKLEVAPLIEHLQQRLQRVN